MVNNMCMTQNITRERKILANIVTNENEVTRKKDEEEEEEKKSHLISKRKILCLYSHISTLTTPTIPIGLLTK